MSFDRFDATTDALEKEIAALEAGNKPADAPRDKDVVDKAPPSPAPAPIEDEIEPTSPEERTWKKRHGDLRRHSQKQIDDLKAELKALGEKVNSATAPSPVSVEEVKAWAEKNPQAAAIIRELAGGTARVEVDSQEITNRLSSLEDMKAEIAREKEEAKILKVHPDMADLQSDEDFHNWVEAQPESFQNMVYDGTTPEVIWAITQYKSAKGIKMKKYDEDAVRGGKSSKATPSDTGKAKKFYESEVDRMPISKYEELQDAISEAMRTGNFVYDLTGGMR